ncbi:hypothetical protein E0L36_21835 [Streptomyces sp. AJS327]|uniref:hypothetical protein n=1 Tax=Streptomyces sp. AJS327 TaxID=2545265 RepID=UPI0015DF1D7E|nr:hypothetical protein [Streptomyces sp. AJS327]MBA0053418.1 hypothetical protein [Streptomyces sp. AJS327]
MDFRAETLRLTPLDAHRHLIDRDSLTLTGRQVVLTTGHRTRREVEARWGDICATGHPAEWETLRVEIDAERPGDAYGLAEVLGAVTRTGFAAAEAWGPYDEQSRRGTYFVALALDFEGQGAATAIDWNGVDFGARLFDEVWGMYAEPGYEPRDADGRRRPFTPVVAPEDGALWGTFATDAPPPSPSTDAVWTRLLENDWYRNFGN